LPKPTKKKVGLGYWAKTYSRLAGYARRAAQLAVVVLWYRKCCQQY